LVLLRGRFTPTAGQAAFPSPYAARQESKGAFIIISYKINKSNIFNKKKSIFYIRNRIMKYICKPGESVAHVDCALCGLSSLPLLEINLKRNLILHNCNQLTNIFTND